MKEFNIEEAWAQLNGLLKTPIYYDKEKQVLYYGGIYNKDDARYYVATVDYLHLPEVSDKNVITFSKAVPWSSVTLVDIYTLATGIGIQVGEIDLRLDYSHITKQAIYEAATRARIKQQWARHPRAVIGPPTPPNTEGK